MKSERDRCIALAGIYQAAELAALIARTGELLEQPMQASIGSLLKVDADSVSDVYGGLSGIRLGLQALSEQLAGGAPQNPEPSRYVITLIHLERQLAKQEEMLQALRRGIESAEQRLQHYPLLHSNLLAQFADLYSSTISHLKPRIMVSGEPLHLQNPEQVNRIRSLLLAGIRSAMLWRQCGGGRFQLLLKRKSFLLQSQHLLNEITEQA